MKVAVEPPEYSRPLSVSGVLKGFDPVPNLVLDESIEYLRDPEDPYKPSGKTRNLGTTSTSFLTHPGPQVC